MIVEPPPKPVAAIVGPHYLDVTLRCSNGSASYSVYRFFPDGGYINVFSPLVDGKAVDVLTAFFGGTYFLQGDILQTTGRAVFMVGEGRWKPTQPAPYIQRYRVLEHSRTTLRLVTSEGAPEGQPMVARAYEPMTCVAPPPVPNVVELLDDMRSTSPLQAAFVPSPRERAGLDPSTSAEKASPPRGLPVFIPNETYGGLRKRLLQDGWEPVTLPDADTCGADDLRCRGRPEMMACAGTGLASCKFAWRKGALEIAVLTDGEGEPSVRDVGPR